MRSKEETKLQIKLAKFMVEKYPGIQFHSDYGSGANLTIGQGEIQKAMNGGRRAWPDMFIARVSYTQVTRENSHIFSVTPPRLSPSSKEVFFIGLFLELKKPGTRLKKKKNGEWATPHIAEQAEVLRDLREQGYCAEFAVGYDEAVRVIKEYLGEPHRRKVEF